VAVCGEYRDEVSACIEVRIVFDRIRKAANIIHSDLAHSLRPISAPQSTAYGHISQLPKVVNFMSTAWHQTMTVYSLC